MKKSKLFAVTIFSIFIAGTAEIVTAQKSGEAKYAVIKNMVDSQQYVFYAQNVIPLTGAQRFLTTDYTVSVSKDTITSDLPYFGRAYTAPMNAADGGIKFTSVNFDYTITSGKKNSWNVTIKPKDAQDIQSLTMTIFENGNASLQVNSTNRQAISFTGYIKQKKRRR